jgi:DNA-binding MarR family transcriptional regulator/GNAT superfamily N-acetyltransferase
MASQPERISTVREFNRFYTHRIGVLQERLLATPFTLTESRLLWEIAHRDGVTAAVLARELDLDPGYVSRLLRGLTERRLLRGRRAPHDARNRLLELTAAGKRAFAPLNRRSQEQADALLSALPDAGQRRLVDAMATISHLLEGQAAAVQLRAPRAGDIGWVVARHGALYEAEYGWDMRFEALVAHIAAHFVERFDAQREACWIAERDGANVGCVFLVQARDEQTDAPLDGVAQLRLLLVEPAARGLGLGRQLVAECTRFARAAGYRSIRLWTNSVLSAARAIYEREGYRLTATEPHRSFGHDLVGETWELAL